MSEPWIDEPGIFYDVSAEDYHADPVVGGSLSCSGARMLIPPSCPAKYHYERENPPAPKAHFELGHAAHRLVLGVGSELEQVKADNWRTKAANEQADKARGADRTPLLTKDFDKVHEMAAALRRHTTASVLLAGTGHPEVTLVWRDPVWGIMLRARLDYLPGPTPEGRLIVPDYKTAVSADPETFQRNAFDHGYFHQAAMYLDGLEALGIGSERAFVFVVQEKTAPYVITLFQPEEDLGLRLARQELGEAKAIYAECTQWGKWPAYSDDVVLLRLPPWRERTYAQEIYE